ncbi:MAG: endonuclease, partial [Candidatus Rifleibacteriota bacterium]
MQKHTICRFFILVIALLVFSGSIFAQDRVNKTPEQLFNKILQQVDDLEQKSPQLQAEIFKLRSSLDELYTGLTSGSLTDPIDAKGKHVVIDLQRGADLYDPCQGQEDEDLIVSLRRIAESSHTPIGYQTAQDKIFTTLDNRDGWVECVYTGRKLKTSCEPDASNMNVEHTWPQSLGATGIAKSDLHHLFPADSKANGIRGNNPFA